MAVPRRREVPRKVQGPLAFPEAANDNNPRPWYLKKEFVVGGGGVIVLAGIYLILFQGDTLVAPPIDPDDPNYLGDIKKRTVQPIPITETDIVASNSENKGNTNTAGNNTEKNPPEPEKESPEPFPLPTANPEQVENYNAVRDLQREAKVKVPTKTPVTTEDINKITNTFLGQTSSEEWDNYLATHFPNWFMNGVDEASFNNLTQALTDTTRKAAKLVAHFEGKDYDMLNRNTFIEEQLKIRASEARDILLFCYTNGLSFEHAVKLIASSHWVNADTASDLIERYSNTLTKSSIVTITSTNVLNPEADINYIIERKEEFKTALGTKLQEFTPSLPERLAMGYRIDSVDVIVKRFTDTRALLSREIGQQFTSLHPGQQESVILRVFNADEPVAEATKIMQKINLHVLLEEIPAEERDRVRNAYARKFPDSDAYALTQRYFDLLPTLKENNPKVTEASLKRALLNDPIDPQGYIHEYVVKDATTQGSK